MCMFSFKLRVLAGDEDVCQDVSAAASKIIHTTRETTEIKGMLLLSLDGTGEDGMGGLRGFLKIIGGQHQRSLPEGKHKLHKQCGHFLRGCEVDHHGERRDVSTENGNFR